jgi:uncharacterized membrane protein YkvA (DUF1232 family)
VTATVRERLLTAALLAGAALLYVVSPLDLIADVIPILGQLDDIAVILFAVDILVRSSPPDVVEEHRAALARRVSA